MKLKAVSLFSGGPDSALATLTAKDDFEITGAFFNVGQPGVESQLSAARRLATICGISLEVFDLSSLKNNFLGLAPNNQIALSITGMPSMNCPFGIFGLAASYAIASGASALISGIHKDDLVSAPHGLTFLRNVGSDASNLHNVKFEVVLPLEKLSKAEVIRHGSLIDFPFQLTRSCSTNSQNHCGACIECQKRQLAFSAAGVHDPVEFDLRELLVA